MSHPLEDTIGPTIGRITAWQHVERTNFALKHIPDETWPTIGILNGKYEGFRGVIVGGGPSIDWELIKQEADARDRGEPVRIFAPNRSHDACIAHGIIPDYGVLMDPSEHVVDYITPRDDVVYLIATGVHWKVLKKFLGSRAMFWTPLYDVDAADMKAVVEANPGRPITFISGGSTVGLRLINILMGWGMSPHLHGFDSAYAPGSKKLYAYDKPEQTTEFCDSTIVSKTTQRQLRFTSNQHMARQAMAFEGFMHRLPETTVNGKSAPQEVVVHGDGPIAWMAWLDGGELLRHANPDAMAAKYGTTQYWDYQGNCMSFDPFVDLKAPDPEYNITFPFSCLTSIPVSYADPIGISP